MPAAWAGIAAAAIPAITSVAGAASGGSGGAPQGYSQSNATSSNAPWNAQIPFLSQGFNWAQDLYNNFKPSPYPGSTVAPLNDAQHHILDSINQLGQSGSPATQQAGGFFGNLLGGAYSNNPANGFLSQFANGSMNNPATNPNLQATIDSTLASTVPGLTSGLVRGGALSNPNAQRAVSSGATSAIAPFLFNQYQQGLQQQQQAATTMGGFFQDTLGKQVQALGMAPNIQNMGYTDLNNAYQAVSVPQQLDQANINADVAKWNYNQQVPYFQLQQYMNAINGNYGGSTTTPYYSSNAANLGAIGSGIGSLGGLIAKNWPSGGGGGSYDSGGSNAVNINNAQGGFF